MILISALLIVLLATTALAAPASAPQLKGFEGNARYVEGDANGDGRVNLPDAVYLVNYLFKAGAPPNPYLAGDANCSGAVEMNDITFLVNALFMDGPPPGPCQ